MLSVSSIVLIGLAEFFPIVIVNRKDDFLGQVMRTCFKHDGMDFEFPYCNCWIDIFFLHIISLRLSFR